jgi:hypothetical protein
MDEAARAVAAAITIECKKDSLRQNQDGTWKLTLTVAELPEVLALAHPGTRYQAVFVELDDMENPIDRRIDPPGVVAKKHFEAMCQDKDFADWTCDATAGFFPTRDAAKKMMGISSANEIIENPDLWNRLWNSYISR